MQASDTIQNDTLDFAEILPLHGFRLISSNVDLDIKSEYFTLDIKKGEIPHYGLYHFFIVNNKLSIYQQFKHCSGQRWWLQWFKMESVKEFEFILDRLGIKPAGYLS